MVVGAEECLVQSDQATTAACTGRLIHCFPLVVEDNLYVAEDDDMRVRTARPGCCSVERGGDHMKSMRDPAAIKLRTNYSNSVRGPVFAVAIADLRDDVCAAAPGPLEDPVVRELVFRAARLRRRIPDDVGRAYRAEAFLALDIMCIYLCGITVEVADSKERAHSLAAGRGVPAEVGSMLRGQVVSGGLPTLGRRRR